MHSDPSGSGTVPLECPDGENPQVVLKPRYPNLRDKVVRADGERREYAAAGGGIWAAEAGEFVEVVEFGGGDVHYAHGIKLMTRAGKTTRDHMPADSWTFEDGASVQAPVTISHSCPGCQKSMKSFPGYPYKCSGCHHEGNVPLRSQQKSEKITQPGGTWYPKAMEIKLGWPVSLVKELVETVKGVPKNAQKIMLVQVRGDKIVSRKPMDDADVTKAGMLLHLDLTKEPLQELRERLSRVDSSQTQLAKMCKTAPWQDDLTAHVLPTDKEPALLGAGGYGRVYRCRPRKDGKDTSNLKAVKQVTMARLAENFSSVRQALVEVCCSTLLPRHDHLIRIDEVRYDSENIYYIMPLIRGACDLHGVIKDAKLQKELTKQKRLATLMHQLLSALQHLHSRGIAHRDVKPENILCDPENDFHATLIDLGLARYWGDPVAQTPGGLAGLPSTKHLAGAKADLDWGDDLEDAAGLTEDQAKMIAKRTLLDYATTPGAMTVAYADYQSIAQQLQRTQKDEERKRRQLPAMDVYGAGATCFAVLVRTVPFLRMTEMHQLNPREWMTRMNNRAKKGLVNERGWDRICSMLDKNGQNFMCSLMETDIQKRLTSSGALQHAWLIEHGPRMTVAPAKTPMPGVVAHMGLAGQGGVAGQIRASAIPKRPARRRPAEDHMYAGTDHLNDQEQAELLTVIPGAGRDLDEESNAGD